jgi:hypothetical protein
MRSKDFCGCSSSSSSFSINLGFHPGIDPADFGLKDLDKINKSHN